MTYVCKNRILLVAQGRLLKVKVQHSARTAYSPGMRGEILGFSTQSRKRMMDMLNRIDFDNAGFICFVTLTYPNLEGPPSHEQAERDRRTFFKRMVRRFPESSAIWRREYEIRKSGESAGLIYPHYHILFFDLPFFEHEELNAIWRDILRHPEYVRTEIKGIKSWRQAMHYVSKYMAKPSGVSGVGRPVGQSPAGRAGAADGGDAAGSLVYGTYLTGDSKEQKTTSPVGRAWGVFNRRNLPLAPMRSAALPAGEWLELAKAEAAEIWPGVNATAGYGFTLFMPSAEIASRRFDEISKLAESLPVKPDDGIPF